MKKNNKKDGGFGEVIWQQKRVSRVSVESEKNVSWVSSAGVNPVDIPEKMGCYMHLP